MPYIPFDAYMRLRPFFGEEWNDWFELFFFIFCSWPCCDPFEAA